MKKQMERTVYEAPVTELFLVELEGSFCGSADVDNPGPSSNGITEQEINTGFESATDINNDGFIDGGWD